METVKGQVKAQDNVKKVEKDAEFKAKKAQAAKDWAARKKAEAEKRIELSKKAIDYIEKNNVKFPEDLVAWLKGMANPTARSTSGTGSFFNKVFGNDPKVGDKITVMAYMQKTFEAKSKLDKYVKEWATKGIEIDVQENKANPLETTYTIKKLAAN